MEIVDGFILVGGRRLKALPGQHEIASDGEWSLHSVPVSWCGRYQNYKLYLNHKNSPKRVWYLTFHIQKNQFFTVRDYATLEKYHPHMIDWVKSSLAGIPQGALPDVKFSKTEKVAPVDVSQDQGELIKKTISRAWDKGVPLSIFGQTRKYGRYAPKVVSLVSGLSLSDSEAAIISMITKGEIETAMFSKVTKLKGLRVTEPTNKEA